MDERYTRYIENLRRVRALVRPEAHAGMKAADLLKEIKQNAAESYTLMQQSNAILDEVIFSRRRKPDGGGSRGPFRVRGQAVPLRQQRGLRHCL